MKANLLIPGPLSFSFGASPVRVEILEADLVEGIVGSFEGDITAWAGVA